ncbi:MAG: ferritin-like domain-containing protein [Rubrobacter sp.]|nr:ferritin-like domain-containing protein [Rubrobacter sp.]
MMDKPQMIVPGAEAFAKPRTRRDFFKTLAVAGIGAAAGGAMLARPASAQLGEINDDIDIANFALTLEFLETEYYSLALDTGLLSGSALSFISMVRDNEAAHAEALIGLIQQFGGTPVEAPEFTFPDEALASQQGILEFTGVLEPTGRSAYLGAAPLIQDPSVLAAAGSIAGVEAEQTVGVRNLLGFVPPTTTPFPEALSVDEVLAAVAPFLGMGEMMDTGGAVAGGSHRAL